MSLRLRFLLLPFALALAAPLPAQTGEQAKPPPDFLFFPDPHDLDSKGKPTPLGDRTPVVVVHGYARAYQLLMTFSGDHTWRGFRGALRKRRKAQPDFLKDMKIYYYYYRPTKPYPELAAEFTERILEELFPAEGARGSGRLLFVAHSAGALMSRYAAADPRLTERTAGILTLAGIHRGSVQASLVASRNLALRRGVDEEHMRIMNALRHKNAVDPRVGHVDPETRIACDADPQCRVIGSLAYDNYDGSITRDDVDRYGFLVNDALREFNESDPNISKIYAYHGDVRDFGMEPESRPLVSRLNLFQRDTEPPRMVPTRLERERRAVEAVNPRWKNADPLVTFESGTFAGSRCSLAGCETYRDVDHKGILTNARVQEQLVEDLARLAWLSRRDLEHLFLDVVNGTVEVTNRVIRGIQRIPSFDIFGQGE